MRMHLTGAPGRRKCTTDFKIKVISRWLKRAGASSDSPATVLVGFSTDEFMRASNRRPINTEIPEYPLFDLNLDRSACKSLIAAAGLPVPPKSACYFCPFSRPSDWLRMRRNRPDLFLAAVELERVLINRSVGLGRNPVYFSRFCVPLDEAIVDDQPDLPLDGPGGESCDEGYCWT